MKSYTDLTQSQMLDKILPIESADMFFCNDGSVKLMWEHLKNIPVTTPCWSLSALLSFLPRPDLHQTKGGQWYCIAEPNRMYFSKHFDNPVDACVDMIVKLTEEVEPVPLNSKILEENGIELGDNRPQHYDLAKYFNSEE